MTKLLLLFVLFLPLTISIAQIFSSIQSKVMTYKLLNRLLVFIAFIFFFSNTSAQTLGSIHGKVIDATTKEPLPFVTIFLARTSIGTASLDDGSFKLDKIPAGKYDLIVSMVGYGRFTKSIEFTGNTIENFIVPLNQVSQELETVIIAAHREKRTRNAYAKFEEVFLGHTSNAFKCKILNKDDVFAYYKESKLVAYANKPIEILNNSLGYKVFYELKKFEADYALNRLVILGEVRFEELAATNGKQKKNWIKERDRAYYGSDVHFLRSLISKKLRDNFYTIQGPDGKVLNENDLIVNGRIQFKGQLNVNFEKENSSRLTQNKNAWTSQRYQGNGQESEAIFNGRPIKVYENGYFEDFHDVVFLGEFQLGGVADMVPLGYTPSQPLK